MSTVQQPLPRATTETAAAVTTTCSSSVSHLALAPVGGSRSQSVLNSSDSNSVLYLVKAVVVAIAHVEAVLIGDDGVTTATATAVVAAAVDLVIAGVGGNIYASAAAALTAATTTGSAVAAAPAPMVRGRWGVSSLIERVRVAVSITAGTSWLYHCTEGHEINETFDGEVREREREKYVEGLLHEVWVNFGITTVPYVR